MQKAGLVQQQSRHVRRALSPGHNLSQEVFAARREEAPSESNRRAPEQQVFSPALSKPTQRTSPVLAGDPRPSPVQDLRMGDPSQTRLAA